MSFFPHDVVTAGDEEVVDDSALATSEGGLSTYRPSSLQSGMGPGRAKGSRGGAASGSHPPMNVCRKWMKGIWVQGGVQASPLDDDAYGEEVDYSFSAFGTSPRHYIQQPGLAQSYFPLLNYLEPDEIPFKNLTK